MFKVNGDNNKMQSIIEKKKKVDAVKGTKEEKIVEEKLNAEEDE